MKIVHRYISLTVISTILLVILALLGLELFIEFSHEFPDMGMGNYGVFQVFVVALLYLPMDIYQFFPMAGLLGCLLGLGLLASRSELIVMRAAGVSLMEITWIVLKAAFLMMLIALLLGEVIAPVTQHEATVFKAGAVSGGQALHTLHGTWVRSGKSYINIGEVLSHGQLQNITSYKFNDNYKLVTASHAESAVYKDGKWIFHNIDTSIFGTNKIISQHNDSQVWGLQFKPKLLGLVDVQTDEKSLLELHRYIQYLQKSGLRAATYQFAFWQRIFQPIATLVMILLAIPFIFGPLRTVPMGLRILGGTIVGLVFWMVNQFIGPLTAVFQFSPLLVASLPTLLVAVVGLFMLLRCR